MTRWTTVKCYAKYDLLVQDNLIIEHDATLKITDRDKEYLLTSNLQTYPAYETLWANDIALPSGLKLVYLQYDNIRRAWTAYATRGVYYDTDTAPVFPGTGQNP